MEKCVREIIKNFGRDIKIYMQHGIPRYHISDILWINPIIRSNDIGTLVTLNIKLDRQPSKDQLEFVIRDTIDDLQIVKSLEESIARMVFTARANNPFLEPRDYKWLIKDYLQYVDYPIVEKYEDWMGDVCPDKEIFDIDTGTFIIKKLVTK